MNINLAGKSVVVTGGGSNIGRAISLAFAREGVHLTVAEIDEGQGTKVAAEARVFDALTGEYVDQVFRDAGMRSGIPVGVFDADGDGTEEVLVGRGPGQNAVVDVWRYRAATTKWLEVDGFTSLPSKHGSFVG